MKKGDAVPPTCIVPLAGRSPTDIGDSTAAAIGESSAAAAPGTAALATVMERSRLLCLQGYEKDLRREDSYLGLYQRLEIPLSPAQLAVFASAWESCRPCGLDPAHVALP